MGFSALAGGIATGFLTSQRERAASQSEAAKIAAQREEARLGRESREGIASDNRATQEKIAENTLRATQLTREDTRKTQLGSTVAASLLAAAKTQTRLSTDQYSEKQISALEHSNGIVPITDKVTGKKYFDLVRLKDGLDAKEQNELQNKTTTNLLTGADPTLLLDNPQIMGKVAERLGLPDFKSVGSMAKAGKKLLKLYKAKQAITNKLAWQKVNPGRTGIDFVDNAGVTQQFALPNKEDITNTGFFGLNRFSKDNQDKILETSPNMLKAARLFWWETELSKTKDTKKKERIETYILGNLRGIFTDVSTAVDGKKSEGIKYTNPIDGMDLTKRFSTAQGLKEISALIKANSKSNVVMPSVAPIVVPKKLDDKARYLAEAKGITIDAAHAWLSRTGNELVINSEGDGSNPEKNSVVANAKIITVKEDPNLTTSQKVTEIKPEQRNVEEAVKPVVAVASDGEETILKFDEIGTLDNPTLNRFMRYDELIKLDPKYFERPENVARNQEYQKLKELYPLINTASSPFSTLEDINELKSKMGQLFKFKHSDGRLFEDEMDTALVRLVSMQKLSDIIERPTRSTTPNGSTIFTESRVTLYSEEEMNDPKKGLRKSYREGQASLNKLDETKENMSSYNNNQRKLQGVATILKSLRSGTVDVSSLQNVFQELTQDPNILENPTLARELNVGLTRLSATRGMDIGTQAASKLTVLVQKAQDILKAVPMVLNDLANKFPGFIKATSFKSENDTVNDGSTIARLRQVETWAAEKGKAFNTMRENATDAAKDALAKAALITNDPDEKAALEREALVHQATAYRAYLLAQNSMTQVSLTYTYAGMVQGQSGGRAISNEDFAILFRAIWGGAGGSTGAGSFDRLEDIVQSLGLRVKNDLKYLKIKGGQSIKRDMLLLDRKLNRQRFIKLYQESKTFNLLTHDKGGQASALSTNTISFPTDIITEVDGNQSSKLDATNLGVQSKKFNTLFGSVITALPATPKKGSSRLSYAQLNPETQLTINVSGMRKLLELNRTTGFNSELKKYAIQNSNLGDIITKIDEDNRLRGLIENTEDKQKQQGYTASRKALGLSNKQRASAYKIIHHLYNSKQR